MTAPPATAEILTRIDHDWAALESLINRLDETALTGPSDAAGWTAKDHLAHLAAWERSLLGLLAGEDRAAATGVDAALFATGDIDAINEAIRARHADEPLARVLGDLRETHERTRATIAGLADADLARPYAHYQPHDRPDNADPVVQWVAGDTHEHYREHAGWIRELVAPGRPVTAEVSR